MELKKSMSQKLRMDGRDYSRPGWYFITLGADYHKHLFGPVEGGIMKPNALGRLVEKCWAEIPQHYGHIALGAWQVMPNHFHGLVRIVHSGGKGLGEVMNVFKGAVTRKWRNSGAGCEGSRSDGLEEASRASCQQANLWVEQFMKRQIKLKKFALVLAAMFLCLTPAQADAEIKQSLEGKIPDMPGSAIEVWQHLEATLHAAIAPHAVPLRRGQRLVLDAKQAVLVPAINQPVVEKVSEPSVQIPAEGLLLFAVDVDEPLYVTGSLVLEPDEDLRPGLRAYVLADDTLIGAPMVKAEPWRNVGGKTTSPAPDLRGTQPGNLVVLTEWRMDKGRHYLMIAGPHMRHAGRFQRMELQVLDRPVEKPLYTFALFADTHLGEGRPEWMNIKMDEPAIDELGRSLRQLRAEGIAFALLAGDMTDRGQGKEIDALARIIRGSDLPVYGCIGNHEVFTLGSRTNLMAQVPGLFPTDETQYVLDKPPLRFIVMDGSWWRDRDDNVLRVYDRARVARMAPTPDEIEWLRQTLAADKLTPTVVMWHYPFYSAGGESSCGYQLGKCKIQSTEVLSILGEASNVVATLNGHLHYNSVGTYQGIICIQNASYAEWPHQYRVFRVYPDRMEWEVRQLHNRGFVSEGFLPAKALTWMISTGDGDLSGTVKLGAFEQQF